MRLMTNDNSSRRRRFLGSVLAVGVGAISGCSSSSTETGTEATGRETETAERGPEATESVSTEADGRESQIDSYVEVDGTQMVVDGEPVYLFGTRPMHVMTLNWASDHIELLFDELDRMGATLARVHAFQPFWGDPSLQPQPGDYNEEIMRRLDRVVEAAQNRGIRLSLMLINGKPPLHNADTLDENFGVNAHTYANYVETAEEYDDFYSNEECMELYKQRVETVLTRENTVTGVEYRNDPTVAMWELGNEIEYAEPWRRDDPTLQPWIDEMSSYVKSIDSNHLVTTGEFSWADRNNFEADHEPDGIDVCSIHYYPGPNSYDLANDPGRAHPDILEDLITTGHQDIEKPVYVGEYNWQVEQGADSPLTTRNEQLRVMHDVFDRTDVAAAAFHALGLDSEQDYPRGGSTAYADSDEGSMAEFRRFAEQRHNKSASGALPPLPPFESSD